VSRLCWSFEHSCNPVRARVCPSSRPPKPRHFLTKKASWSPCILFSFIIYLLLNFSTTLVALLFGGKGVARWWGGRVAGWVVQGGWCGPSLFRMPSNGSSVQLLLHATLSFKCPCVRCKRRRPFYVPRLRLQPLWSPFSAPPPVQPTPSPPWTRWPVDFNGCSSPRGVPAVCSASTSLHSWCGRLCPPPPRALCPTSPKMHRKKGCSLFDQEIWIKLN